MTCQVDLELGGLVVPGVARYTFSQTYETFGGETLLRCASGRGIKQRGWIKLRTQLDGEGWIPEGLTALDYTSQLNLKCVAPRGVMGVGISNVITIPSARRSDIDPRGYGIVNGNRVFSTTTMAGDVATVASVINATGYLVEYWPELTVYAKEPDTRFTEANKTYSWSLTAEEV